MTEQTQNMTAAIDTVGIGHRNVTTVPAHAAEVADGTMTSTITYSEGDGLTCPVQCEETETTCSLTTATSSNAGMLVLLELAATSSAYVQGMGAVEDEYPSICQLHLDADGAEELAAQLISMAALARLHTALRSN